MFANFSETMFKEASSKLSFLIGSFVFAESAKLTSLGGDHSLASMIGSLCDNLEKKYGALVTRLYRVFGSTKGEIAFKTLPASGSGII